MTNQLPASNQPPFGAQAALYFLDNNNQALFCRYDNGGIHSKLVGLADIQAAVTGSEFDSGWISHEMLRFGNSPAGRWEVTAHAARVVSLSLDDETITIPVPKTIMICHGTLVRVFAVADEEVTPETKMYIFPLPHVGEDGSICWGSVTRKDQMAPGELLNLFLASGFSAHSVGGKSRKYPDDIRRMLRALSEKHATKYPVGDLMQLRNRYYGHQTLDGFLNEVIIKNG